MRALEIAALLEMLQVAANRRERDADRLRQFLDRGRPALADMLQHEGPALCGYELRTASWDHGCSVRLLEGAAFCSRRRPILAENGRSPPVSTVERGVVRFAFGMAWD